MSGGRMASLPDELRRCEAIAAGRTLYTDSQIIGALQAVAVGKGRCTSGTYRAAYMEGWDIPSPAIPAVRFGSWSAALHAAGLPSRALGHYRQRMPDEHLWDEVRRCARDLDKTPTVAEYTGWAIEHGAPCAALVRRRFGGWRAVVRELGIQPSPDGTTRQEQPR